MPDWMPSVLTNGVADQQILGHVLQPSAFGVLLLVSLVLFVSRREFAAVASAILAAAIHPTYLFQAAILIVGFVAALLVEKRRTDAIRVSSLAFLLLGSLGAIALMRLGSSGADARAAAELILYSYRIPHHADIAVWSSALDLWRLLLVVAAILIVWRHRRLRSVMLAATTLSLTLTMIQLWTGNRALALAFPWRASVWLVPVATVLIMGRVLGLLSAGVQGRLSERRRVICSRSLVLVAAAFMITACVLGIQGTVRVSQRGRLRPPVCDFVERLDDTERTYLVPLGFEGFRLETGAPIFVDWKSHPYRDDELVEWFDRVKLARAFYTADSPKTALQVLRSVRQVSPIAYIITDAGQRHLLEQTPLSLIYADAYHAVFATSDGRPQ